MLMHIVQRLGPDVATVESSWCASLLIDWKYFLFSFWHILTLILSQYDHYIRFCAKFFVIITPCEGMQLLVMMILLSSSHQTTSLKPPPPPATPVLSQPLHFSLSNLYFVSNTHHITRLHSSSSANIYRAIFPFFLCYLSLSLRSIPLKGC
jgi:hypothetical protein